MHGAPRQFTCSADAFARADGEACPAPTSGPSSRVSPARDGRVARGTGRCGEGGHGGFGRGGRERVHGSFLLGGRDGAGDRRMMWRSSRIECLERFLFGGAGEMRAQRLLREPPTCVGGACGSEQEGRRASSGSGSGLRSAVEPGREATCTWLQEGSPGEPRARSHRQRCGRRNGLTSGARPRGRAGSNP